MRVWLVDDKSDAAPDCVEGLLRQLEKRPDTGLQVVGTGPFQPELPATIRKLAPDLLDLLVISERAWPEGPWLQELLSLGLGAVILTAADHVERFRPLAASFPVSFVLPSVGLEGLWLSLISALA